MYQGSAIPAMQGVYLFGDFVSANLWGLYWTGSDWRTGFLLEADFSISTFGQDEYGEVYVADYDEGGLYRIEPIE